MGRDVCFRNGSVLLRGDDDGTLRKEERMMHNQAVEDQIGSHDVFEVVEVEDITERDPNGFDAKKIIDERNATHGDFYVNALISQQLKGVIRSDWTSYKELPDIQREALDMIIAKF